MQNACLCILCGLPGSGKTTLCNYLLSCKSVFTFMHICYDHLIPWIDFSSPDVLDSWKRYRNQVLELVKFLINVLSKCEGSHSAASFFKSLNLLNLEAIETLYNLALELASKKNQTTVLLIDDNMPYRRMRYEYFQIARINNIGCCTIMVDCSFMECKERNENRPIQDIVQQKSLKRINAQMERPDAIRETWEKYYCTINSQNDNFEDARDEIIKLLCNALQNPVSPLPVQDQQVIEESRLVNRKNLTHQADLCLRILAGEFLKKQNDPKFFVNHVALAKKHILDEVKSGHFDDHDYVDNSGCIDQKALKLKIESLFLSFIDDL